MVQQSFQINILTKLLSSFIPAETLALYEELDWDAAIAPFTSSTMQVPDYYRSQNFHGIEQGYLNPIAPITYDFVTAFATPPNELRIRQQMIQQVNGQPQHVLDLGCGTGSGTLLLRQKFSEASIVGLDLSPYMLVMAKHKAQQQGVNDICWEQGLAERTQFPNQSFDLITISMVFHETPYAITREILKECDRLLKSGGQVLILDGHQRKLRHLKWLTQLFREPYSYAYAQENLDDSLAQQGFYQISTQSLGWISQLTTGLKANL